MIVVLAEKPSVARDIAHVLKCNGRKDGYLESATHRVTWAFGHLVSLKDPKEMDPEKYGVWRRETLPILPESIPKKVLPSGKDQFKVVKSLLTDKATKEVICATDAGREGELIFWLIYEQAGCKKPVKRLWVSSLTDVAIQDGLKSLKPASAYDNLRKSAVCRQEADWLIGMNGSRAFSLRYGVPLNIGRVQTPTLAILVKRELEIRNFVPTAFSTVTANFGDYTGQWYNRTASDDRTAHRISDKAQALAIQAAVKGKTGVVDQADTTPKRELPLQLFDLTSLQREANKSLGFTAEKTLKVAQALYEQRKALTYPRTDSRFLSDDIIPQVEQALQLLPGDYQPLAKGIVRSGGKLPYSKRVFDASKVTDHHAIIPTNQRQDLSSFTADERALYDMVTRRFIAAFYPAYEYDQTTVITVVEGEPFRSYGRMVDLPPNPCTSPRVS